MGLAFKRFHSGTAVVNRDRHTHVSARESVLIDPTHKTSLYVRYETQKNNAYLSPYAPSAPQDGCLAPRGLASTRVRDDRNPLQPASCRACIQCDNAHASGDLRNALNVIPGAHTKLPAQRRCELRGAMDSQTPAPLPTTERPTRRAVTRIACVARLRCTMRKRHTARRIPFEISYICTAQEVQDRWWATRVRRAREADPRGTS